MADMPRPTATVGSVEGTKMVCQYTHMTGSRGLWAGHDPFDYSTPLLMAEVTLIFIVMRTTYALLKPLGQSMVIAQIVGGLIIGPSFLGRNQWYMKKLFPIGGRLTLETIADFGFTLHIFVLGVQMDTSIIKGAGKKAMAIGILCTLGPYLLAVPIFFMAGQFLSVDNEILNVLPSVVIINSLTSFIVITSFLTDLKILNSEVGRLASSSSMVSDMFNWFIAVAFRGMGFSYNGMGMASVWNLLSLIAYTLILVFVIRPLALWVIRNTPEGEPVKEIHIFSTLLLVMVCAFYVEVTGQHTAFGAYMLGLAIPDGPPLGAALVNKIDTIVSGLFLPLYFVVAGLGSNLFHIGDFKNSVMVVLVIILCYIGKFTGTILPSLYCRMPFWDSFSLSLIMCSKGIIELAAYILWKEKEILNNQCYTVLLISLVVITGVSRPLVTFLYDPSRRFKACKRKTILEAKPNAEFRILGCIHTQDNVPTIIKLLEVSNSTRQNPITVFVLHLMELTGRASAILTRHPHPQVNKLSATPTRSEPIVNAFNYYEQNNQGHVMVQHFTSISPYASMHNDICTLALDKRTSLVLLPFHKQWAHDDIVESSFHAIRTVNLNVLDKAPCSVGILVDREQIGGSRCVLASQSLYRIALLFLGGTDDRETLAYARRMAEHPTVSLIVVQFSVSGNYVYGNEKERTLDLEAMNNFRVKTVGNERIGCKDEVVSDGIGTTRVIHSMGSEFDLFMVGRHHESDSPLISGLTEWNESPELGIIGDMLATSDFSFSVLVVQQQPHGTGLIGSPNHPISRGRNNTSTVSQESSQDEGDEIPIKSALA